MKKYDDSHEAVLKRFMQEFFPFSEFRKIGFFTKDMRGDYPAQAKRVCDHFGYKTVFEYGAKEIRAHISYAGADKAGLSSDNTQPFITVIPSIYE